MRRTFLKRILPKDERKRETILLIISESAILYIIFLFIYSVINNISINDNSTDNYIIISLIYFISYTFISYISSEILREDISSKKQLIKHTFQNALSSFFIILIVITFLVVTKNVSLNIVNIIIAFAIFFVPLNIIKFIELFISYKANKDLFEE